MSGEHEFSVDICWASDGKLPDDKCVGDVHIYYGWDNLSSEGIVCQCGKTKWHLDACPMCGHTNGKPIPNDAST